ncbi:MAG: methyltransferase type 11, partial [Candidatus Hydrogenedentota bacterium]
MPKEIYDALDGKETGEIIRVALAGADTFPYDPRKTLQLDNSQFERKRINGHIVHPRFGRFYPAGLLKGLRDIFSTSVQPFRCIGVASSDLEVDFNHPLTGRNINLEIAIHDIREKTREIGGQITDWMEIVL